MKGDEAADIKFAEGNDLLSRGEYEAAAERFSEVIDLCPDYEGAWGNRGYARFEIGRDDEALADFDRVVRINPEDAFGHGYRALALRNLGRYGEALQAAVRALELADEEEDCPPARLVRGWLFARAGQFAAACEDLEIYLEETPEDEESLRPLADLCRDVLETGRRECTDGPGGRLACASCLCPVCGYSFNTEPNPNWREEEGRCLYSHCIETMPYRSGDGHGICPVFGHDCPGGEETIRSCEVVERAEQEGYDAFDDAEGEEDAALETPFESDEDGDKEYGDDEDD